MKEEVLRGAAKSIKEFRPVIHMEQLKSGEDSLESFLEKQNCIIPGNGSNLIVRHEDDPIRQIFSKWSR